MHWCKTLLAVLATAFLLTACKTAGPSDDSNSAPTGNNSAPSANSGQNRQPTVAELAQAVLSKAAAYWDVRARGDKSDDAWVAVRNSLNELTSTLGKTHALSRLIREHDLLRIWDQRWVGPSEGEHKDKPEYNLKAEVEKIANNDK